MWHLEVWGGVDFVGTIQGLEFDEMGLRCHWEEQTVGSSWLEAYIWGSRASSAVTILMRLHV